jgi:hypothetical protein
MRMALIGVALGLVAALLLTRLMTKLLYGVECYRPGNIRSHCCVAQCGRTTCLLLTS